VKNLFILLTVITVTSCSSRSVEKDYKVVNASHEDKPEWIKDLEEWLDDEEVDFKNHRYYIYTTEAKTSKTTACEIAKARVVSTVASEVSTFIKQSFNLSKYGDPTAKNTKLGEYVQDDLAKEIQAYIVGAQIYKTYWEKKRFLKDKGAQQDWDGWSCSNLIKISKDNLKKAFKRSEKKISQLSNKKDKTTVQNIMKDALNSYTNDTD
jgi:hypothetical protein